MRRRAYLALLLPLLVLDCFANMLVGESFRNTLSAKAHDAARKGHKYWGWTEAFINALFFWQKDAQGRRCHCRVQWEREERYGSLWAALAVDWKTNGTFA